MRQPRWIFVAIVLVYVVTDRSVAMARESLRIEIRETGGWSRPVYPCSLELERPTNERPLRFRLLDESSHPVLLQVDSETRGKTTRWLLAFPVTLDPHQRRQWTLQFGPDVEPSPRRRRGHVLGKSGGLLTVTNAPYLVWTIPDHVGPVLQSLEFGGTEHIRGPTGRLSWIDRSGASHVLGIKSAPKWRAVRSGPLAVTLRGESSFVRSVESRVELDFPVSRSWVRVDWQLEDPTDRVAAITFAMDVNLDPPKPRVPTLADLGAGTFVYSRLGAGQTIRLETTGKRRWRVLRGPSQSPRPYVLSHPDQPRRAEGWLHVMDRTRCLALAVGKFGEQGRDSIECTASGRVVVRRAYPRDKNRKTKRLRTWLHFVGFPPQESAATSPRHMQTPPEVRVVR